MLPCSEWHLTHLLTQVARRPSAADLRACTSPLTTMAAKRTRVSPLRHSVRLGRSSSATSLWLRKAVSSTGEPAAFLSSREVSCFLPSQLGGPCFSSLAFPHRMQLAVKHSTHLVVLFNQLPGVCTLARNTGYCCQSEDLIC